MIFPSGVVFLALQDNVVAIFELHFLSISFDLHLCEGGHDEGAEAGAADGDPRDERPPLVKVLSDAVQPGQVDDAEPQPDQPPGTEVEEEDGGRHGGETEPSTGQDGPDDGGQSPAQLVGHVARHRA